MTLFEQLKNIPKIDLHINITGSISTDLAFSVTNESSIQDLEDKMIQKNVKDLLCFSVNDRLSATLIQFFNFLLKKWLTRGKRRDTITTSLHSCGCIACRCKL